MQRKFIILLFITIFLISCISETTNIDTELTPTSTILHIALTATKTITPTVEPTATPYGGNELPRVAIFTELEPDDTAAGYIRIGTIDSSKGKIFFDDIKLRVGTEPDLSHGGYRDDPQRIQWSPNGDYLSYAWIEDEKAIIYVYDFKNKKQKWELELELPRTFFSFFRLDWSADSNWLSIHIDLGSYYVLDINNGEINNMANEKIQGVEWHHSQPLLFFENFGGTKAYQYDPIEKQISQIEPIEFDPTKFEGISSWDSYGRFDADNDGYLFSVRYEDDSQGLFLQTENAPMIELLRIENTVTFEQLDVYRIIPSPDKSHYLILGQTNLFLQENYETFISTFTMKAKYPMVIENVDTTNAVYPISWSPDGKSYIGYQNAWASENNFLVGKIQKIVIIDAETNSVIKDYDINDGSESNYGFFFTTGIYDSSGPVGIDIFWK